MLSYTDARQIVIDVARRCPPRAQTETIDFAVGADRAIGRVLAEGILADRPYPPFDRSTRDGFAVHAADAGKYPEGFRLVGESRAGVAFEAKIAEGECVRIMTGGAVPPGADAVVMQENAELLGGKVRLKGPLRAGQNIVVKGSEARSGDVVAPQGTRLGYAELAMAAQVGCLRIRVHRRTRLAILSTGDEVVPVANAPGPFEIRNSNGASLEVQAALAGAEPVNLGNAPDRADALREFIERGLGEGALVMSGGVSVGKYDLVENVLRELGAKFHFDAVAIRPGRPAVFAECRGKLIFGLPGNPVSTMVTFELFAVPALDILSGAPPRPLPLFMARLAKPVEQRAPLTHFLPAHITWQEGEPIVEELPWQGSGDIGALVRANCFLVVSAKKLKLEAGELVDVLPRRGLF